MSRSRRHTPIIGVCANARTSEAEDKRLWHKAFRQAVRQAIYHWKEMPHFRAVSNPWNFSKDGKVYIHKFRSYFPDPKKVMRK